MERSLGTGGHTEGLPTACSVSAVPETLTARGPKRPPSHPGGLILYGIVIQVNLFQAQQVLNLVIYIHHQLAVTAEQPAIWVWAVSFLPIL